VEIPSLLFDSETISHDSEKLFGNVAFACSRAKQFNRLAIISPEMTVAICDITDRPSLALFVSD